jgi:hypothetical protein
MLRRHVETGNNFVVIELSLSMEVKWFICTLHSSGHAQSIFSILKYAQVKRAWLAVDLCLCVSSIPL